MNKDENINICTSLKDQTNLPRYFRRIFKILLSLKIGSVEVKLPDERIFRVSGKIDGLNARIQTVLLDWLGMEILASWKPIWMVNGHRPIC